MMWLCLTMPHRLANRLCINTVILIAFYVRLDKLSSDQLNAISTPTNVMHNPWV